ncbi:MAG: helix-turn-helix domain-containing protein, partial [Paramuribaculum sp.]|nr:helix-turn-helix domain-containing protein [Paramuribaculum sp.]
TYPVTVDELANIPGVGSGKAKRYGNEFVKIIRRYVDENEIERPEDLVVRTVPNKSKVKIAIIHSIDRKIPLDEIARTRGMELDELLEDIEGIVNSGTKINLRYYIDDILDEDQQEDIFDYFRDSETGSLEEAYRELGDEYSEEEIRLMRIMFLSEMGY